MKIIVPHLRIDGTLRVQPLAIGAGIVLECRAVQPPSLAGTRITLRFSEDELEQLMMLARRRAIERRRDPITKGHDNG